MSLIAYARNTLAADSRTIPAKRGGVFGGNLCASTDPKIKKFGKNNIAVAVCGTIPSDKEWITIGKVLLAAVIKHEVLDPSIPAELKIKDIHAINAVARRFIVMSKKNTYSIALGVDDLEDNTETFKLPQLENTVLIAFGTATSIAYACFAGGFDAGQAVELAVTMDITLGKPIIKVKRSELEDFELALEETSASNKIIKNQKGKS